jgi:hypothetical protein
VREELANEDDIREFTKSNNDEFGCNNNIYSNVRP